MYDVSVITLVRYIVYKSKSMYDNENNDSFIY